MGQDKPSGFKVGQKPEPSSAFLTVAFYFVLGAQPSHWAELAWESISLWAECC